MNVLIVEDDFATRKMVRFILERQSGHQVREASDGASAIAMAEEELPDLAVVDVMMPDRDGLEVCRHLRRVSSIPILMVSARNQVQDKVRALLIGADDYLTKPFDPAELAARVTALARRAGRRASEEGTLRVGDLALDFTRYTAQVGERAPVALTPTEFRLLLALARPPGKAFTREQLLSALWGSGEHHGSNTVSGYVADLRRKLEPDPSKPRHILTVRGIGYKLAWLER